MSELWRVLRDPRVSTVLLLVALSGIGLAVVGLGYRGAAATLFVVLQTPFALSGGFAGLALLGLGLGLLRVHLDRVEAAEERSAYADLQRATLRLVAAAAEDAGRHDRAPSDRARHDRAPSDRGRHDRAPSDRGRS